MTAENDEKQPDQAEEHDQSEKVLVNRHNFRTTKNCLNWNWYP